MCLPGTLAIAWIFSVTVASFGWNKTIMVTQVVLDGNIFEKIYFLLYCKIKKGNPSKRRKGFYSRKQLG